MRFCHPGVNDIMRNGLADKVYMVIFISQVQVRSVFLLMVQYTISHVNIEDIGLEMMLLCTTANTACCSCSESPGGATLGQWPNGSAVSDRIVNIEGDKWKQYVGLLLWP